MQILLQFKLASVGLVHPPNHLFIVLKFNRLLLTHLQHTRLHFVFTDVKIALKAWGIRTVDI